MITGNMGSRRNKFILVCAGAAFAGFATLAQNPAQGAAQSSGPASDAIWTEVRSANFVVRSNAGEKRAREIDEQLERIRTVFHGAFRSPEGQPTKDPRVPPTIFAPADAITFRAMLPREWALETARQPPGVFLKTADRFFVLLRSDLRGDHAYQLAYHEYFHIFAALNLPKLPVWLSEGLADFYSATVIRPGAIETGRGMLSYKLLLRNAALIPLAQLFSAKQNSALYTDAERSKLFYAQSWALVHMLQFSPAHEGRITELLARLRQGESFDKAQREVLGDPTKLQSELQAYVRNNSYPSLELQQTGTAMPVIASARQLTEPESMVAFTEYNMAANRMGDARRILQVLMRSAPDTPGAHDAFGQYLLLTDDDSGAWAEFSRAILLGSRDWRTHYSLAKILAKRAATPGELLEVEKHLNSAVMLNAESPEAASALAGFLLDADRNPQYALQMATRAAELEPHEGSHQILIARALAKMGRPSDSLRAADQAVALASDAKEKAAFESFRQGMIGPILAAQPQDYRSTAREIIYWVKDEAAEEALRRWKAARAAVANIQTFVSGRVVSVACPARPGMQLELETDAGTLKLGAVNANVVAYYVTQGTPPKKFDACSDLKDKRVDVVYRPTPKASTVGQILAIEMQ